MLGDLDIFLALFGVRTHKRLVRRQTAEGKPVLERVAAQTLQIRHIDAVELLFQDFERVEPGVGGLAQAPVHRSLVFREMPVRVARNGDRIPATRPGSGLRRLLRFNVARRDGQAGQTERGVFQKRTSIRIVFHRRLAPLLTLKNRYRRGAVNRRRRFRSLDYFVNFVWVKWRLTSSCDGFIPSAIPTKSVR